MFGMFCKYQYFFQHVGAVRSKSYRQHVMSELFMQDESKVALSAVSCCTFFNQKVGYDTEHCLGAGYLMVNDFCKNSSMGDLTNYACNESVHFEKMSLGNHLAWSETGVNPSVGGVVESSNNYAVKIVHGSVLPNDIINEEYAFGLCAPCYECKATDESLPKRGTVCVQVEKYGAVHGIMYLGTKSSAGKVSIVRQTFDAAIIAWVTHVAFSDYIHSNGSFFVNTGSSNGNKVVVINFKILDQYMMIANDGEREKFIRDVIEPGIEQELSTGVWERCTKNSVSKLGVIVATMVFIAIFGAAGVATMVITTLDLDITMKKQDVKGIAIAMLSITALLIVALVAEIVYYLGGEKHRSASSTDSKLHDIEQASNAGGLEKNELAGRSIEEVEVLGIGNLNKSQSESTNSM